jgi:hypothetical protein
MPRLRRVEAEQAGPGALGILVPPAKRTFVILRPRALPWDLLLCRGPADLAFRDLAHDEATAAAQALFRALREGPARAEAVAGEGGAFHLLLRAGSFALVACPRCPGQPYAPLACGEAQAAAAAARLGEAAGAADGEVYFNTRHFERLPAPGPARA